MAEADTFAEQLNYLKENDYRFRNLHPEIQSAIEQDFTKGFSTLSPEKQAYVSSELVTVKTGLITLAQDPPSLADLRQREFYDRIRWIGETAGVVAGAEPGLLENVRELAAKISLGSYPLLDAYDRHFMYKKNHTRSSEIRNTADDLMQFVEGIRSELSRLSLTQPFLKEPWPEQEQPEGYDLEHLISLIRARNSFGLIGFMTLEKLVQGFFDKKNYSSVAGAW